MNPRLSIETFSQTSAVNHFALTLGLSDVLGSVQQQTVNTSSQSFSVVLESETTQRKKCMSNVCHDGGKWFGLKHTIHASVIQFN